VVALVEVIAVIQAVQVVVVEAVVVMMVQVPLREEQALLPLERRVVLDLQVEVVMYQVFLQAVVVVDAVARARMY
jgi:hypothetical protein